MPETIEIQLKKGVLALCVLALAATAAGAPAQEFKFDAAAFERKPVEITGYAEWKPENFSLHRDAAFYKLNFYDKSQRSAIERSTVTFKPQAKLRWDDRSTINLRAHLDAQRDSLGTAHAARFDEAYWSYKPAPGFTLEV